MGSATFTVISIFAFSTVEGEFVRDPARIAAQVARGIGFIGAGSGLYVLAVGGAVLAIVILAFFTRKPGHGNDEEE